MPVKNSKIEINLLPPDEIIVSKRPKRAFNISFSISKYLYLPFGFISITLSTVSVKSFIPLLLGSKQRVILQLVKKVIL